MESLDRKSREKLQHKTEILEAAERIFSENGYYNTSIQEIADTAEFSVGTIYNFFKSKDELYLNILKFRFDEYIKIVEEVLNSGDGSLRKMRQIISAKIKFFEEHKCFFHLYFHSAIGSEWNIRAEIDNSTEAKYDKYMEKIELIFSESIKKEQMQEIDPANLAIAFEGLTNAFILHWARLKKQSSLSELIPQIEKIFFEQILK